MFVDTSNYIKSKTNFVEFFNEVQPFEFESGDKLNNIRVAYQTYGELNEAGDNAVLICHALTGNAHAAGILSDFEFDSHSNPDYLKKYSIMFRNKEGWWDNIIGPGKAINTDKYFVICSNILGSCYGTSGPTSLYDNYNSFQNDFPKVTVRDMVKIQKKLIDYLKIKRLKTIIGGSLGGMQVLEWPLLYPEVVDSIIPIATSAKHSAWAMALNQIAKEAILNDPNWNGGFYNNKTINGLSLARKVAMISYRSFDSFEEKFSRDKVKVADGIHLNKFQINNYLDYQGEKFINRFDANTYIRLADAMDNHDITRGRDDVEVVLNSIKCNTLSIGISSDVLYPVEEQLSIAGNILNCEYREIKSNKGHDAFLIEFDQLGKFINEFLY
ncbi:MAG: homoserine O-acetyltransferase [Ignavibacteria bacterium]|jgi:homoserine O-acetyltransferase